MLREALDDVGVPVYGALRRQDLPRGAAVPAARGGAGGRPLGRRRPRGPPAGRGGRRHCRPGTAARAGPLRAAAAGAGLVAARRPLGERSAPATAARWSAAGRWAGRQLQPPGDRRAAARPPAPRSSLDPLRDEALPVGTRALVVGGALPEAYAEELSANRRLCIAVAELARTGRPVVAEGAGLLWLARELDGLPMCGVLDAVGVSRDGLVVGYREATAQTDSVVAAGARCWSAQGSTARCSPPRGWPAPGLELGRVARRRASSGATCTPPSSRALGEPSGDGGPVGRRGGGRPTAMAAAGGVGVIGQVAVRRFPALTVSTPRTEVRQLTAADAAAAGEIFADKLTRRWLPLPDDCRRRSTGWPGAPTWPGSGATAGTATTTRWSGARTTRWWAACGPGAPTGAPASPRSPTRWRPHARGFGFAAEAVDAVAIALILEHGFQRVELRVAPGNLAVAPGRREGRVQLRGSAAQRRVRQRRPGRPGAVVVRRRRPALSRAGSRRPALTLAPVSRRWRPTVG